MAQYKIPAASALVDQQFIQIQGANGVLTGYQYDLKTNSLYATPNQVVIPAFHGFTHVSSDPVPNATTDTPGLMSSTDKARLDQLIQMRLGVLGFTGAGFPNDNGFMKGDIILAAGSEFISLERIGNVIRFTVDSPLPLSCNQESCAQIFWVQDETDTASIRPPSCAGKLPGVNSYGELKVYLMPKSTLVNPNSAATTLNTKGNYPAMIFKRYDNSITPGAASFDLILQRNSNGTSQVGWSMVPGSTGIPQSVWFMGLDNNGGQIRFDLDINKDPKLLGQLLYNGHSITKQMGVIVDYTSTVVSNNQYKVKFWSVNNNAAIGDTFVATNVWRYLNPTNSPSSLTNPQTVVLDATIDLLPIGTLVSLWEFKIGEIAGNRLKSYFFSLQPPFNSASLWTISNQIRFGDQLVKRAEVNPSSGTDATSFTPGITDRNLVERQTMGITGFDDPLMLTDDGASTNQTHGGGNVIRSDSVTAFAVGNLMSPINPNEPSPNFTVRAAAASLGGAFAFVVNGLVNRVVQWTSGALQGTQMLILENSAATLTLEGTPQITSQGQLVTLKVGDTFDIFVPNKTGDPSGVAINNQYIGVIDISLPGLKVVETLPASDHERPVFIWDRINHKNSYVRTLVGMPTSSRFPPVDILLRAPVDSFDGRYGKIVRRSQFHTGPFAGRWYIVLKGANWNEIPKRGTIRTLTGIYRNTLWSYTTKLAFDKFDDSCVALVGSSGPYLLDDDHYPYVAGTGVLRGNVPGAFGSGTEAGQISKSLQSVTVPSNTTVVEVLHQDFSCTCVRCEFSIDTTPGQHNVQLQFRVGQLDMGTRYEYNIAADPSEEFVRGFLPGSFAVSKIYTQTGWIVTGNEAPAASSDFKVYSGGFIPVPINGQTELWNELEIMYRDSQIWIWWNKLLINPDPILTANLPTPIVINTPYFPATSTAVMGKTALRLWPGSKIREFEVRDQAIKFNEFAHGQLELSTGSGGSH